MQALLGYGDGDVFGMSCLCVCGPSSEKKGMRQVITLQRSGQPGGAKILCYKRDGTPFWSVRSKARGTPLWCVHKLYLHQLVLCLLPAHASHH